MNINYIKSYKNIELIESFAFKNQIGVDEATIIFEDMKSMLSLSGYIKLWRKRDAANTPSIIEIDSDTYIIDEMWHSFILRTKEYADFCKKGFGYFIDHNPVSLSDKKEKVLWSDEGIEAYRVKLKKQLVFIAKILGVETLKRWYKEYPSKYRDPMIDIFKTSTDWLDYYEDKKLSKVRETTLQGVSEFKKSIFEEKNIVAIDLGCGDGTDINALLMVADKVVAIDSSLSSKKVVEEKFNKGVEFNLDSFEEVDLPSCHIVNASYSLPFCNRKAFLNLWEKIESSLVKDGIFCGHFFGVNSINLNNNILTLLEEEVILDLFKKFKIVEIKEEMKPYFHRNKYVGERHIYSVIARKL